MKLKHHTAFSAHIPSRKNCVCVFKRVCLGDIRAVIKPQQRTVHLLLSPWLPESPLIDELYIFHVVIKSFSSRGCCKYSLLECQPPGQTGWLSRVGIWRTPSHRAVKAPRRPSGAFDVSV